MMQSWIVLVLLVVFLHGTSARLHSLKNFCTLSSEVVNFPELSVDRLVDDVQIVHYDSDSGKTVPRVEWMDRVTAEDPQYLDGQTDIFLRHLRIFRGNVRTIKQLLNPTGGVHVYQVLDGCEWDDETGDINGFSRAGFGGEDFLVYDLKTEIWNASNPQAVIIKQEMDKHTGFIAQTKVYLTQQCPESLKMYVDHGKSSLMRTDLPSVSLLQKTPSSPVRCFATGFYPDRAMMFWTRDGVEIHEDVEPGEILPNQDGTFQMSVDLNVSSVRAEDWGRLDCVFQFSGVKEDMVTRLDRAVIKTNEEKTEIPSYIEIIVGVAVVLAIAIAVIGFLIYRRNCGTNCEIYTETQPHGPTQQSESETAGTHLLDKSESSSPPSSTPTGNSSPSPSQHESV